MEETFTKENRCGVSWVIRVILPSGISSISRMIRISMLFDYSSQRNNVCKIAIKDSETVLLRERAHHVDCLETSENFIKVHLLELMIRNGPAGSSTRSVGTRRVMKMEWHVAIVDTIMVVVGVNVATGDGVRQCG